MNKLLMKNTLEIKEDIYIMSEREEKSVYSTTHKKVKRVKRKSGCGCGKRRKVNRK